MKTKLSKPETVSTKTKHTGLPVHGIYGLLILFVCVSIAYANYMVFFGTSDTISKLMLIPSTLFVGAFAVYKAVK